MVRQEPEWTVIMRHKASDNVPGFAVVHTMAYRPGGRFSIVRARALRVKHRDVWSGAGMYTSAGQIPCASDQMNV